VDAVSDPNTLGPSEVWLHPSVEAEARGWAATMTDGFRVEVRKTGRGERSQASGTDLFVPAVWGLPTRIS